MVLPVVDYAILVFFVFCIACAAYALGRGGHGGGSRPGLGEAGLRALEALVQA